jgi:hypothetical protein
MNPIPTNQVAPSQLQPGTAIRTHSTMFPVMHWGMIGYGSDSQGYPLVWHSQKSDTLRCTSYLEFCGGQSCEIVWVPANRQQAHRAIERLRSKEGLPWHLTQANCEMVIRWAIEDKAVSHQLAFGALAAIAVVAVVVMASSGD